MRFPPIAHYLTGVSVPVAALKTSESAGIGEFLDLVPFGRFCASAGLDLIQILPVNDSGSQSSPYSALSAFALHPIYLRLSELPEFGDKGAAAARRAAGTLRTKYEGRARIPYGELLDAKLAILRKLYDGAAGAIAESADGGPLGAWIEANPWVVEYAVYRRLKAAAGGVHWKDWPSRSSVSATEIGALWAEPDQRKEQLFWTWLQWRLDGQFAQAAGALKDLGIALKGDLPILMNDDSCDVWAHPEYFRRDISAGAPPDMFSPLGQNWQFPVYDWAALAADDYAWWKRRLAVADRYYAAYRIDHVLGFFRIWAASRKDRNAALGRFEPSVHVDRHELEALGFDRGRIRWLSRPHIPTSEVYGALMASSRAQGAEDPATAVAEGAQKVFDLALDRIGNEDLWLFKETVGGELEIEGLGLDPGATDYLLRAWRDRTFLEFEESVFTPTWTYWETRAFASLSEEERRNVDALVARKRDESEILWERQGRAILSVLTRSTAMLPCAEDLGAVPACVPRTLGDLGILSLRIPRWTRSWDEDGEPYVPLDHYPLLSVCSPAVHDTSTLREWWLGEADRNAFRAFSGRQDLGDAYRPDTAAGLLETVAQAASLVCVFQIQDLLHLREDYYAADPKEERINVPGSVNDFNWNYRIPVTVEKLNRDSALVGAIRDLAARRSRRPLPKGSLAGLHRGDSAND